MTSAPAISGLRTAAVRVIVPFALGYFLSYLFRAVNAVIAPDLIRELHLDANTLGLLTSVYFLTFAAFQLPLGVLLDRYGARRTECTLLLIAALGAVIFAVADGVAGLIAGRALIGLGVSACLMAAFKAFTQWFPAERLPLVNSIQMTAGGLGALSATKPVEWLLHLSDWRTVFWALAALSVAAALILWWGAPEKTSPDKTTLAAQWKGVRVVFHSKKFRAIAPWATTSQTTFIALQSLWCGPWLADVAGLPRDDVALYLALTALFMIGGFLSLGAMADRLSRGGGINTMHVAAASMIVFMFAQAALLHPAAGRAPWLWLAFGFFGTSGILTYAVLSQRFPKKLAGRANTALNLLVFWAAFFIQWGVGAVIDLWSEESARNFNPDGYRAAFAILLAVQIATCIWFFAHRGAKAGAAQRKRRRGNGGRDVENDGARRRITK